jgi:hypothetical protein
VRDAEVGGDLGDGAGRCLLEQSHRRGAPVQAAVRLVEPRQQDPFGALDEVVPCPEQLLP